MPNNRKPRTHLTNLQKEEICRLYEVEKMPPSKIAALFGLHPNATSGIIRRQGKKTDQLLTRVNDDEINQMVKMYVEDKMSSEIIAKILNKSASCITRNLRKRGIEIRPATQNKRQYQINEDYFSIIDTEHKAYFLGFLYADGNLSSSSNSIKIGLQESDRYILEEFSNDIYGFSHIKNDIHKNDKNYPFLAFYSAKIHQDLIKLGCTPQKTFTITFPIFDIVPRNLMWHFIRGFMDGDGCISVNREEQRTRIDFTANKEFIEGLAFFIEQEVGIKCRKIGMQDSEVNTRNIQIGAANDLKKLLAHIYQDATIYLTRKKDKFEEFLNMENEKISKNTQKHTDISKYGTTYIPEFNGKLLTSQNIKTFTQEEKEDASDYLMDFYRKHGFPYPILTNDELLSSFMHLVNTDPISILKSNNVISINNQNGLPIFKHFAPHFYDVKSDRQRKFNMIQAFNDDNLLKKVIDNRLEQNFNMTGNMLKQGMTNARIAYQASIFVPSVAKFLYSTYTKEDDIIYDYSMGFGQRLLGALSLPYRIKYIGVDPLMKTVQSNQDIFNFFNANKPMLNKEVELLCRGAENYCDEKYHGKIKMAFSSPPYWNIENYSDETTQASSLDYTTFINKWWRQVAQNIEKLLTSDGLFVLNIVPQIKPFNIKEDMINIIKECGFKVIQEYQMQLSRNTEFHHQNTAKEHKYEPIIVLGRV